MLQFHASSMCDGGDLDCGSGLLLIIKKHMDPLTEGDILEIRSRERTVAGDLPVWCSMVKHQFLGSEPGENWTSYFVEKGNSSATADSDIEAAKGYEWTVRTTNTEGLTAKVHSRNHSFTAGQPAEFSSKVDAPSAVDYLLASLASCITVGYQAHGSRRNFTIDHIEMSLKGKIDNVLYHMELEDEGGPELTEINGTFYITAPHDDEELRNLWKITLDRSPVYQTLKRCLLINLQFS